MATISELFKELSVIYSMTEDLEIELDNARITLSKIRSKLEDIPTSPGEIEKDKSSESL